MKKPADRFPFLESLRNCFVPLKIVTKDKTAIVSFCLVLAMQDNFEQQGNGQQSMARER